MTKGKEENILDLFYNNPTKHWHFEEIIRTAKISRPQVNNWLKKFLKDNLIKKLKPNNKMPYYVADYESFDYQNKKRLFALEKLNNSGFFRHLLELPKAKTIIWSGPMGYTEKPTFKRGTEFIYYAITENVNAFTIVGGGDTLASVSKEEHLEKIDHISTGGGAMLEFIQKGTLPGLEALG